MPITLSNGDPLVASLLWMGGGGLKKDGCCLGLLARVGKKMAVEGSVNVVKKIKQSQKRYMVRGSLCPIISFLDLNYSASSGARGQLPQRGH